MHNASIRGALGRSAAKFNVAAPGPGASREDKEKYPYQRAAYALCTEWEEWVNVVEHVQRVQLINANLAAAGPGPAPVGGHVLNTFGALYAVAGAGWFKFSNYLNAQIGVGHTAGYDANAALPGWKGKALLQIAQYDSSASLEITSKQLADYTSGKSSKVKAISNNPFKNEKIIKDARGRS
jgi:hypothetical protein